MTRGQRDELVRRFTHHPPVDDQSLRYERIRAKVISVARLIVVYTPPSREQNEALKQLELAVMWANAAIARREDENGL